MKKAFILNGSPRKKGNTSILIQHLTENINSNIEIEQLFLYDISILPCIDCRACKKGNLECVLKDGMKEIYPKLDDSDLIVIGTPIYWFGPTATTKLFLDRFRPYFVNKKLSGKKAALILPAGSGAGDCGLTTEMFKRSFDALGVELIQTITSEAYDAGDTNNDAKALSEIKELAMAINSNV